jgi:hypothetical protein
MPTLIVNLGGVDGSAPEAKYLERFDPDWVPPGPQRQPPAMTGRAWWTDDPAKAQRFAGPVEALTEWKRQSTVLPIRPWDGRPNRPLTAYTIGLETVEE